uniref:BHLH domain-containing protein n=1 Tax=Aegilops tauschii subsp. strangulata TaxID=200361 RepID=A0A453DN19_AEGTS
MKSRRQSGRGGAMLPDGGCSGKMERKDVEKNRRLHMKGLCLKLSSLLPASSAHHLRHYSSTSSSPPSSNKVRKNTLDSPPKGRLICSTHAAVRGTDT